MPRERPPALPPPAPRSRAAAALPAPRRRPGVGGPGGAVKLRRPPRAVPRLAPSSGSEHVGAARIAWRLASHPVPGAAAAARPPDLSRRAPLSARSPAPAAGTQPSPAAAAPAAGPADPRHRACAAEPTAGSRGASRHRACVTAHCKPRHGGPSLRSAMSARARRGGGRTGERPSWRVALPRVRKIEEPGAG